MAARDKWFVDFRIKDFTPLQWAVHIGVWISAIWLIVDAITGNLTFNPIQAATQRTGKSALILLALSLACTPLSSIFGLKGFIKVRRALGLYAALYVLVHFAIFIWIDYRFNLRFIWADSATKPYIWVGLIAATILLTLGATSFRWWMRKLGKAWKRLHKLVYVAAPLIILHFAWVRKGSLTTLSGDMIQPLLFGLLIALLLITRIGVVRRTLIGWAGGLRTAVRTRRKSGDARAAQSG